MQRRKLTNYPKTAKERQTGNVCVAVNGQQRNVQGQQLNWHKYPEAADKAYTSLITYQQKDPELKTFKSIGAINSIADLYVTSINKGKKFFNENNWQKSFDHLKRAVSLKRVHHVQWFPMPAKNR